MSQFQASAPLNSEEIVLIKATVPILESAGGEALVKLFYQTMFTSFPEVQTFFNQSHQRSGQQPRALLHSVLMYAKYIDNLGTLTELVKKIAHKHCSVLVLPEHYPIVGTCLLRAMRELLGPEIATDELIAAWAHAYQLLAELLISVEESIYADHEKVEGGWRGARTFVLERKEQESEGIASFYFKPKDGGKVMIQQPGQYIGVQVSIPDKDKGTIQARRNYSLSTISNGDEYRISIQKECGGLVSSYLHDRLEIGDTVLLSTPCGEFVLPKEIPGPVILIAGGVGITPLIPMLEAACNEKHRTEIIQCMRTAANRAFVSEIDNLVSKNPNAGSTVWYSRGEESKGHLQATSLHQILSSRLKKEEIPEAVYFVTGPPVFMDDMRRYLLTFGVPVSHIRYETFGPETLVVRDNAEGCCPVSH